MAIDLNNGPQANALVRRTVRIASMYRDLVTEINRYNTALTADDVVNQFNAFPEAVIGPTGVNKAILGGAGVGIMAVGTALGGMTPQNKAAIDALLNTFAAQSYLG